MTLLIVAEHNNRKLHANTFNLLHAAQEFSTDVHVVVVGYQCRAVVDEASTLQGVQRVLYVDHPGYEHSLAEQLSSVVVSIASHYQTILAAASTFGKNVLPRVAAYLGVAQISDVTRIINSTTFEHPIYAGNAIECVESLDSVQVLTIRTTSFSSETSKQPPCSVETLQAEPIAVSARFISQALSESKRPDLGAAKMIVSGGRGLQSAEKFKLIEELADVLGAAVGASRAAVDAGFVPNDYQVGQTGKVVAPELYIAIGISGAIQHLAGMKDSKIIVAINKDEDAPIFQVATYGLIGDLFQLVPELIQLLKTR
mgnify:CR=1 FL=1